ncbi:MAG: chemotaxis protein CheD [bacterium]
MKPGHLDPIKVGMAELAVAQAPSQLTTVGLGSCVGVVLYDSIMKIGGLAHVMLPSIEISKDKSNKAKFADTAIAELIEKMIGAGAHKVKIRAKIFGGANMFANVIHSKGLLDMGRRNVESVKVELEKWDIKLDAEETGGTCGRTITLDIETGKVHLRTATNEMREY